MKLLVPLTLCCAFFISHPLKSATINLMDEKELAEIMNSPQPVIIKFFAHWCGICNSINQPFEELSEDPKFKTMRFVCIDIDRHEKLSQDYGIIGVPTFVFFNKGKKKGEETGVQNIDTFKKDFKQSIENTLLASRALITTQPSVSAHQELSVFRLIKKYLYNLWDNICHFFKNIWTVNP